VFINIYLISLIILVILCDFFTHFIIVSVCNCGFIDFWKSHIVLCFLFLLCFYPGIGAFEAKSLLGHFNHL
jgi:hypothetical protein